MKRGLNHEESRLLGLMVRAGENGRCIRILKEQAAQCELERRGYIEWVDLRMYLVTVSGRAHWDMLQEKAHGTPPR